MLEMDDFKPKLNNLAFVFIVVYVYSIFLILSAFQLRHFDCISISNTNSKSTFNVKHYFFQA